MVMGAARAVGANARSAQRGINQTGAALRGILGPATGWTITAAAVSKSFLGIASSSGAAANRLTQMTAIWDNLTRPLQNFRREAEDLFRGLPGWAQNLIAWGGSFALIGGGVALLRSGLRGLGAVLKFLINPFGLVTKAIDKMGAALGKIKFPTWLASLINKIPETKAEKFIGAQGGLKGLAGKAARFGLGKAGPLGLLLEPTIGTYQGYQESKKRGESFFAGPLSETATRRREEHWLGRQINDLIAALRDNTNATNDTMGNGAVPVGGGGRIN